jgi:hypothetical protein
MARTSEAPAIAGPLLLLHRQNPIEFHSLYWKSIGKTANKRLEIRG